MSQFRTLNVVTGIVVNPWVRNIIIKQSSLSLCGKLPNHCLQKQFRIGSFRGLHYSPALCEATTITVGQSIKTATTPEISVESIGNVAESIQGAQSSSTDVAATLTEPASSVGFIFSDSPPVLAFQDLLCQIRDIPGMEWTTTIVLTTIGIRLFVGLPIAVVQQKSVGKLQQLQPEIKQLAAHLARETSIAVKVYNWNKRKANNVFQKSFKKHWKDLMELHNCHPMRAVALGLLQVPFWVCLSGAIRNVVYCLPIPATDDMLARWNQIAAEGTPWIDSLTATDPIIFPLIFLTANLLNIQLNSLRHLPVPQTTTQKVVPWVFRFCVGGIAVFAMFTPSAVTMYWATSSVLALLQTVLFRVDRFRLMIGLLPIPKATKP